MATQGASAAADTRATVSWRERLRIIIFEADTRTGRIFDIALLWTILLSTLIVILESVGEIREDYGAELRAAEWTITILFTVEYVLRLVCVPIPWRYGVSLLGLVDLLAILPTYASLFVPGSQSLAVIRTVRLLRIFRVLKLSRFLGEANVLAEALTRSRHKVLVFLGSVLVMVVILGSLMYLIEGPEHGFTSIPRAMYWAIVTMTTVGYGDVAPQTPAGQILASIVMIIGFAIIAIPTGIVTAEIVGGAQPTTRGCPECLSEGHLYSSRFCRDCGAPLAPPATDDG